jgi:hypothetical protein
MDTNLVRQRPKVKQCALTQMHIHVLKHPYTVHLAFAQKHPDTKNCNQEVLECTSHLTRPAFMASNL